MQLDHTDIIPAPLSVVYSLVKDKLPDIVPYLPSVKRIDKLEEQKLKDNCTRIVNQWYAKVEVPSMVKKFLSEDLFSWKDIALWQDSDTSVSYELESSVGKNLFTARGKNHFKAAKNDTTELRLSCQIEIHAENIPGIPKLMARGIVPTVEKIIEKMLQPNMTSLGEGIRAYLAANN